MFHNLLRTAEASKLQLRSRHSASQLRGRWKCSSSGVTFASICYSIASQSKVVSPCSNGLSMVWASRPSPGGVTGGQGNPLQLARSSSTWRKQVVHRRCPHGPFGPPQLPVPAARRLLAGLQQRLGPVCPSPALGLSMLGSLYPLRSAQCERLASGGSRGRVSQVDHQPVRTPEVAAAGCARGTIK